MLSISEWQQDLLKLLRFDWLLIELKKKKENINRGITLCFVYYVLKMSLHALSQILLLTIVCYTGGMVVLPMGDLSSILSSADQRYLQVVTINGQPALQLVGGSNLAPQQIGELYKTLCNTRRQMKLLVDGMV